MSVIKVIVHEKRGNCPIFNKGDSFYFKNFWLRENQGRICVHALPNLLHYIIAFRNGISSVELGLSKEEDCAFIQCPDCGPPYTNGGTIIFKIIRED